MVEGIREIGRRDEEQPELRLEDDRPVENGHRVQGPQILEVRWRPIVTLEAAANGHLQQRCLPRELVAPPVARHARHGLRVSHTELLQHDRVARRRPPLFDVQYAAKNEADRRAPARSSVGGSAARPETCS